MGAAGVTAGAAVVGAGASAYSALGSKKGAQSSGGGSSVQQTAPWADQQKFLDQSFDNAKNVYAQQAAAGAYPGELYAPINGDQTTAASAATGYANGAGAGLPGLYSNAATQGVGAQVPYLTNAAITANSGTHGANQGTMDALNGYAQGGNLGGVQTVNGGLSSALNQAGTNGANAINSFNQGLSSAANRAAQDPTAQLAADAGTYMNASPVQQSVDSTNRMIDQTLNEQTLPGLNRQAAMGGALNSSRAGAANAMAQEGAAIAKGNADASLYNNAYNTGLQTANSSYGTGLGAQVSANTNGLNGNTNMAQGQQNYQLNQQQAETGTRLSAGEAGLASQLGYNQLASGANAQLGAGVNQGLTAGLDSGTAAVGNYGLASTAGGVAQANQQQLDNQAMTQWQQANGGAALQANQNYISQINGNYGSSIASENTKTQQNPYDPVSTGLGTAATLAGLYKNNAGAINGLYNNSSLNSDSSAFAGSSYNYNPVAQGYVADTNNSQGLIQPLATY